MGGDGDLAPFGQSGTVPLPPQCVSQHQSLTVRRITWDFPVVSHLMDFPYPQLYHLGRGLQHDLDKYTHQY